LPRKVEIYNSVRVYRRAFPPDIRHAHKRHKTTPENEADGVKRTPKGEKLPQASYLKGAYDHEPRKYNFHHKRIENFQVGKENQNRVKRTEGRRQQASVPQGVNRADDAARLYQKNIYYEIHGKKNVYVYYRHLLPPFSTIIHITGEKFCHNSELNMQFFALLLLTTERKRYRIDTLIMIFILLRRNQ
jgi:hypothetical protein